ncbi:unnamed protein product, partial [Prunus brigantina]
MGDFIYFECGLQMLATCRQADHVIVHLLVCLLLLDLLSSHQTAYQGICPSFSQGQVDDGSKPTLIGGSTMLGGNVMKVARSGHGALRWYDDGRGRCSGSNCESGKWHGGSCHTGWLLWCDNKGLFLVHGVERQWSHHVDRGIVGGVALGSHGLSHH